MSAGRPSNHLLKFDWATEHLELLDEEVRRWREVDGYSIAIEFDPNTREHVARLRILKPIPDRWALLIGDIAHNFRSSLDQLAYSLMFAYTPTPTNSEINDSEFPIFGKRPPTANELRKKIGAIDPQAQAVIEGLQPHHGGPDYSSHPLWVLHDINNIDKHRLLHVTATMPTMLGVGASMMGRFQLMNFSHEIGDGAELLRFHPNPAEVEVNLGIHLDITLGYREVPVFLTQIRDYIKGEVFAKLQFLPPSS